MNSSSKLKQQQKYLVLFISVLAIAGVLFVIFRFSPPQPSPMTNTDTIESSPPADDPNLIYEETRDKNTAFGGMKDKIKNTFMNNNHWKSEEFTIEIVSIDTQFVAGYITANNSTVPEGVFIVENVDTYPVVFDTTYLKPCDALEEDIVYPAIVAEKCNLPTPNYPVPSNAIYN